MQDAEQRPHLGERLAPGALDQLGGRDRAGRIALQDPARAAGLHDHHRDGVRDDVVHLTRDPAALVGDRALGLRLARLGGAHGGLVQLGGEPRAAAHSATGDQEEHPERGREEDVARDELLGRQGHDAQRAPDRGDREQDAASLPVGAGGVGIDDEADEGRRHLVGVGVDRRQHRDAAGPGQDRGDRGAAARERQEDHDRDRDRGRHGRPAAQRA